MKWNKTLQEETLIKNINPGYPFGIIIISTLQMREWTITRVKGLTQVSWLSGTARADVAGGTRRGWVPVC